MTLTLLGIYISIAIAGLLIWSALPIRTRKRGTSQREPPRLK